MVGTSNGGQKVMNMIWLVVEPPLWKLWLRLGWGNSQLNGKIIHMFQTTNQRIYQQISTRALKGTCCFNPKLNPSDLGIAFGNQDPKVHVWSYPQSLHSYGSKLDSPTIGWLKTKNRLYSVWFFDAIILIHSHTWWLIPLSKWVISPVINGISRVNPLIIGVMIHLRAVGWAFPYAKISN